MIVVKLENEPESTRGSPAYMSWNKTRNMTALSRSRLEIQKGLLEQWKRDSYTQEEV